MENTSKFHVTPCSALAEGIKLDFRGLYLYYNYEGKSPNQVCVLYKSKGVGALEANNWDVKDGLGPDANVVARAQGLHMNFFGLRQNSFSLVFEIEWFKGSTLEVIGLEVVQGEWTIVGGTGQFAMATGIIYKRLHEKKDAGDIVELAIEGFSPRLKGSRVQILPTKIGTWGGDEGSVNDIVEPTKRLESITIHSGYAVDSIEFSYVDQAGQKRTAGPWGGVLGDPFVIRLHESEFVKEVSGTVGDYEGETIVTSIKLVTNVKTYGPFGLNMAIDPSPFIVPVPGGSSITGFYARSGKHLNAIGVYVAPLN